MQRTGGFRLPLSVAVALGLVLFVGCAALQRPEMAPPPGEEVAPGLPEAATAGQQTLRQAVEAYAAKDYKHARELFVAVLEHAEGLSEQEAETARNHVGRIDSILHQQQIETATPAQPEKLEPEVAHQKAVELLRALDQMAREGKVAEAVGGFDVLDGLRSSLTLAEKAEYDELRAEFQTATRSLKPLSEDEKVARAEGHFEAGLAAYKGKDYAAAARHLKLAAWVYA